MSIVLFCLCTDYGISYLFILVGTRNGCELRNSNNFRYRLLMVLSNVYISKFVITYILYRLRGWCKFIQLCRSKIIFISLGFWKYYIMTFCCFHVVCCVPYGRIHIIFNLSVSFQSTLENWTVLNFTEEKTVEVHANG